MGFLTLAWISLWLLTHESNASAPTGDDGATSMPGWTRPDGPVAGRWTKRCLMGLGAVPLLVATVKHGLSGNTLVLFHRVDVVRFFDGLGIVG